MNKILPILFEAKKRMPVAIGQAISGDMLLTLLFWKLLSDWWRVGGLRYWSPYGGHDPTVAAMEKNNQPMFTEAGIYEACQWSHTSEAGQAVRAALYAFANAQSSRTFRAVLRPERFGPLSEHGVTLSESPTLAQVVNLIGGISAYATVPQVSMGHVFTRAVDILQLYPDSPSPYVAKLMAQLLHLQPGESVYDPQCACGQLLLACVAAITKHRPDHQLVLYGQDSRVNQWAIARMQLLMKGLLCHHLETTDALDAPLGAPETGTWQQFDGVLLVVPEHAMEWDASTIPPESLGRFPLGVPQDSRLALVWHALVWHALATLNAHTGRLCLWIDPHLLESQAAYSLRRYLIEHHLLDIVIRLPHKYRRATDTPGVLMLIRAKSHANAASPIGTSLPESCIPSVTFIADTLAQLGHHPHRGIYDVREIGFAHAALRKQQTYPFMRQIDHGVIARHGYSLALASYDAWLRGRADELQAELNAEMNAEMNAG